MQYANYSTSLGTGNMGVFFVAENLIEDDDDKPSGPLPPIFLSYQWAHQPHIKLLRQHLEWAGYPCWMDLGQMGGGDKLFAKIDAGMRAAKVIVCCVTEKYAKSDNCNREVSTANFQKYNSGFF